MTIQSKHFVLLALIALPAYVPSSGTQSSSPIHALEMAGSSRETAVAAISTSNYYAYQVTVTVEACNMQLTERALDSMGIMSLGMIVDLDKQIAVRAAHIFNELKLARQIASSSPQRAPVTQPCGPSMIISKESKEYGTKRGRLRINHSVKRNSLVRRYSLISVAKQRILLQQPE